MIGSLNLYFYSLLLTTASSIGLGVLVLYKRPHGAVNRIWFLMSLAVAGWSYAISRSFFTSSYDEGLYYSRLCNIVASYISAFFFHFCLAITNHKSKTSRFLLVAAYVNCVIFGIFGFSDFFSNVRSVSVFKYYASPGPLFYYYTVHFFLLSFCSEFFLFKSLKHSDDAKKNQIKFIIVGTTCGFVTGGLTFLPVYGVPINPVTAHFVWLYVAIISYAILKHQLMDIKVVIKKTLFYSFWIAAISLIYVLIIFFVYETIAGRWAKSLLGDPFTFGISYGYAIPPLFGTFAFSFLGFFLLFNKPRTKQKVLFSILCFETFYWQVIWFVSFFVRDSDYLTYLAKLAYLTIVPLPFTFYHFIVSYLDERREERNVKLFYGIAALLIALLFPTSWFVAGNRRLYWGNFTYPGPLFSIFTVATFISMIRGLLLLHRRRRSETDAAKRNQLNYLFLGFALYFGCTLDFLQVYGVPWYPIGTLFFLASFLVIAYAITKHQLLDVKIAIRKTLFYSLMTLLISVTYLSIILILHSLFLSEKLKSQSFLLNFLLILFVALTFKPLEVALQRLLDRRFFHGTISEIAEQKALLETELERRERLKSVGILAAGMAHEIKNPLTAINTFADYLPEKYDDPEFREKFSRIVKQEVARVKEIVANLLLFSKPADPHASQCDVQKIITDILELLSNETLKNNIHVHSIFDASNVYVDADQIKQAFLNIIMNAIDAMKENGGELKVESRTEGKFVEVTISDTGCGIAEDKIKHIFDPFFTDKEQGTGLGLAVTYSIIEKNHGKIEVQSRISQGTKFLICLPGAAA